MFGAVLRDFQLRGTSQNIRIVRETAQITNQKNPQAYAERFGEV